MSTTARPRRTNAERTAATRAKILEATADCLTELGYGQTSTTEVARRAGVSRGALLHNFPTRTELVVAAAGHVVDQRIEEVRALGSGLDAGGDRADAVIELLFAMSRSPTVEPFLEVVTAGRTDPELKPLVESLCARSYEAVSALFTELFPRPADPTLGPFYDAVPVLFMAITDGLVLQRITGFGTHHHDAVLELTKLLGHTLLQLQEIEPGEETPCP
jgi:AcrR family transcriptional regulator